MPDPSWNIFNHACTSLSGWTDLSSGDGSITTVTEDGRSCYKYTSNTGDAQHGKFISSFTSFTLEIVAKLASTSSDSSPNTFLIQLIDNGIYFNRFNFEEAATFTVKGVQLHAAFTSPNYLIFFVDANASTWVTYRFVCTGSGGSIHCFVDGQYFGSVAYGSGNPSASANQILLGTPSGRSISSTIYVDSIKMSTTQEESTQTEILRVHGENLNARLGSESYSGFKWSANRHDDPVRFVKGSGAQNSNFPYCLPYVATGDANASPLRLYDNATTYAFQQWPALP